MKRFPVLAVFVLVLVARAPAPGAAPAEGQRTWATHVALAPAWFDPAEAPGILTPFIVPYEDLRLKAR